MIAGVDEQDAVLRCDGDAGRFARRQADRVRAGIFSAVELRDRLRLEIERADAAVVGVGDEKAVAIRRDTKWMLQARDIECAIEAAEVEQAGADDGPRAIALVELDRANRR